MLARLDRALSGFAHPGSDRAGAWDLVRLPDLLPYASDPGLRAVIERFAEEVAPRLDALPHQVVHNDFHPGNVLVAGDRVTGVLDFGDTARTPRIGDLAIALTYLVPDAPRPWPGVEAFLAGYESVVELLPEERAVLPMLMAARTVARTVINQVMHPGARVEEFYAANARKLARILGD
jgi:Ser/Thr protein kinase RdoA (MazF antagonist)